MKKIPFITTSLFCLMLLSAYAESVLPKACTLLTTKEVTAWLGTGLSPQEKSDKAPITKSGSNQVTGTAPSSNCAYVSENVGLNLEVVAFESAKIALEQAKARQEIMKFSMPNVKIVPLDSPSAGAFTVEVMTRFPTTILGFTKKNIGVFITVFQKNKNSLEVAKKAAKLVFNRLP